MSRRRRGRLGAPWELLAIVAVAGAVWLVLTDALHAEHTAAGIIAGAVGGVLVGFRAQPWADRTARRFGVRIVRAKGGR
jgi:drug/metabolite transporter (DMT)-like permease